MFLFFLLLWFVFVTTHTQKQRHTNFTYFQFQCLHARHYVTSKALKGKNARVESVCRWVELWCYEWVGLQGIEQPTSSTRIYIKNANLQWQQIKLSHIIIISSPSRSIFYLFTFLLICVCLLKCIVSSTQRTAPLCALTSGRNENEIICSRFTYRCLHCYQLGRTFERRYRRPW